MVPFDTDCEPDDRPSPLKKAMRASDRSLNSNSPLDMTILANIETLQVAGKPDLLTKIITSYLNTTPPIVKAIQEAVELGNAAALHHAAHSLKSSSAAVGAVAVSILCQELESMGRLNQMTHAADVLQRLAGDYTGVQKALTDHLAKRRPGP